MTVERPKYIEQLMNARGNSQRGCGQRDCQVTGRASTDVGSGFCGQQRGATLLCPVGIPDAIR